MRLILQVWSNATNKLNLREVSEWIASKKMIIKWDIDTKNIKKKDNYSLNVKDFKKNFIKVHLINNNRKTIGK
jgi:hypothetical protein